MLSKWSTSLAAAGAIVAFTVPSIAGPAFSSRAQEQNASQLAASDQTLESPFPYYFPQLGSGDAANSGQFPMPLCHGFKLEEATIDQLQNAMDKGTLSSVKIVMCYLQRIYQTDAYLRAIMEVNPDFLQIAEALDRERAQGYVRGKLYGVPFIVKDNIASKDKMETTAGSWALLGSVVPRDSHVVSRLRGEGAVLMGHATLSEWADMRSNYYSEGYSARGGQCRSPYNLTVNPGGSSSGSGAAVAANLITFSLGTETDGSVINPAERNALVGIKPTVGLTSRAGVIPESHNQDSVGCLARTVRDATYCLDGIYGQDPRDNYTLVQKAPADGFAQYLATKKALKGAVFGLPWLSFWQYASANQQQQLLEVVDLIKSAGATIINGTELPNHATIVSPDGWNWDYGTTRGYPNESEYTYIKADFYNDIKAYLADLGNTDMKSLEDIVKFNNESGEEGGLPNLHPAFQSGQDGFDASLASKGIMDETYWQALNFCHKSTREDGIDAALHIFTICQSNIGAGSDTTAITLSSVLYHLLKHPATYKRLQDEIDAGVAAGAISDPITFKEATQLPYLQAVIKEGLRLHSATGLPLSRVVPPFGATLAGQKFPAGSTVGINAWVAHRNTSVYGADADTWRPERWLDIKEHGLGAKVERYFFAFGMGSRTCIGKNLSLLEVSKLIPEVVRRFEFVLDDEVKNKEWRSVSRWFVKPENFCGGVVERRKGSTEST